jgi:hypothetical protein
MGVILVFVIHSLFFNEQDASNKPAEPPPLPILTTIAPRYTMYLDPGDAQSLGRASAAQYVLVEKSNTQFVLRSHTEETSRVYASTVTIIIDPHTLDGTVQRESRGTIESGVVKLEPNQFGGFDYTSTYPGESKSRHAVLKPQWW